MRLGLFLSAGGSALDQALNIAPEMAERLFILTDRDCAAEQVARRHAIPHCRIQENDRHRLSESAAKCFKDFQVSKILLMFSRLITAQIYEEFSTFNIHPSLLPAFPGMRPIHRAEKAGVKIVGATLHKVDSSIDAGPIVAQVSNVIPEGSTSEDLHHLSYIQKTYLTLLFFCMSDGSMQPGTLNISHRIMEQWYWKFMRTEWRLPIKDLFPL